MNQQLVPQASPVSLDTQSQYVIKRKAFAIFDRTFRAYTMDGQLIMLIRHPLMKLREEFTVFADEARQNPIMHVKARQALAINFSYDITDAQNGQLLGTVQKQGLKSILRDKFHILDATGVQIGEMEEQGASILRRFFPWLTSKHEITMHGQRAAFIKQVFRFFGREFQVTLDPGVGDRRFVLACALLALMAEARREQQ